MGSTESHVREAETSGAIISARREAPSWFGDWRQAPDALYHLAKDLPIYRAPGLAPAANFRDFLAHVPLLTRHDLRTQFPHGFLPSGVRFAELLAGKKVEVVRTSGTSSDRLQVLWSDGWWQRQEIAGLRSNPYIASRLDDHYREAVLTTPLCSENVCQTGPSSMAERSVDYLLFLNTQHDPSHWDDQQLARMLDELDRFKPVSIDADPVYLASLARFIERTGRPAPHFDWIVLAYELVTGVAKKQVRQVFDCPVFDVYGLTEAGLFFIECLSGRHHFCGTDSVAEIVHPDGVILPPDCGELVVTTWGNSAQPLLRYRTGDLVTVEAGDCACGQPGPTVRQFEGRARDLLKLADGRAITPRQIDSALSACDGLIQYRCVQETAQSLRVEYVHGPRLDPAHQIAECLCQVTCGMKVMCKAVPFISPEPSGKYRTVVPR